MLFKRNWLETRLRLWLAMAGLLFLTALTIFMYQRSGGADRGVDYHRFLQERLYTSALVSAWPMISLVMGSVGLACRNCHRLVKAGTTAGSLHYLLTLPVTRWQLLVSRLQVIAVQVVAASLVQVLSVLLLSPLVGQAVSLSEAAEPLPLMICTGAVFAAFGLLLSLIIENEGIALGVGYGIVVPIAAGVAFLKRSLLNPEYHWIAAAFLICFLLSFVQVIAAKRILATKEF